MVLEFRGKRWAHIVSSRVEQKMHGPWPNEIDILLIAQLSVWKESSLAWFVLTDALFVLVITLEESVIIWEKKTWNQTVHRFLKFLLSFLVKWRQFPTPKLSRTHYYIDNLWLWACYSSESFERKMKYRSEHICLIICLILSIAHIHNSIP